MSKPLRKYFWDTSIFLMVLMGEKAHGEATLEAARRILRDVETGAGVVVASEIVVAEILQVKVSPEAYEKWEAFLQLPRLQLRAVDHPVAIRAARLRANCLQQHPPVRIKMADALHVATYLLYGAEIDELHSVDEDFKKALKCSGEKRQVTKPTLVQPGLPFAQEGAADEGDFSLPDAEEGSE